MSSSHNTAVGREHGLRLDEGLSNFGLDAQGQFFYLDDDMYDWDDWLSLARHRCGYP